MFFLYQSVCILMDLGYIGVRSMAGLVDLLSLRAGWMVYLADPNEWLSLIMANKSRLQPHVDDR